MFWLLTELISLLRELENNHLIYVVCQTEDYLSEFYYQGKDDYRTTQIDSVIKINKSDVLQEEKNGLHSVCRMIIRYYQESLDHLQFMMI